MSVDAENHVTDWLPAFVLGALTDDETRQVAEHLASCQTCQKEYSRLQQAADELPLALAQTAPPPHVKENLMRAIRSRKEKPTPSVQPAFWEKLAGSSRMALPALGLAIIVLLAISNLLLWRQLNLSSQQTSTPMRMVALANTQDSPGALGTIIMDPQGKYGTLVVDSLAILGPNQQYQVWLVKGGVHTSGGVFSVNMDGYATLEIMAPLPLVQYDSIGVTIEPAGGSPGPTGTKVLGGVIPR